MDDFGPVMCSGCKKMVFPPEKLVALKKPWHKWCLKCTTCKSTLSLRNIESHDNMPYCRAHMLVAKAVSCPVNQEEGGE
jgi:LIM domain